MSERWIITTTGDRSLGAVAKDLSESAGLQVESMLEEIGIIVGTAEHRRAEDFESVSGVLRAEPESPVGIGPPDSPETW